MDNNKPSVIKRMYLSYKDDTEKVVQGYFDVIEETDFHVKFRTKANIITISRSRILKMKESI